MDLPSIEIFPWNENFATGIPDIDQQHGTLIGLINQLVSHLAYPSDAPTLNAIFDQLTAYAARHFAFEEAIWRQYLPEDPWETRHAHAHSSFLEEVNRLKAQGDSKSFDAVIEELVAFLTRWLAFHILESDRRLAKVVLALPSGMSLAQAKELANDEMAGTTQVMIDTVMALYENLAHQTVQLTREMNRRRAAEEELRVANPGYRDSREAMAVLDAENRILATPAAAPAPPARLTVGAESAIPATRRTSATILCVDDEPINLDVLRETLGQDYALIFTRNGKDALRAARKQMPALILLDIQMPDMDGYEVCRRLKAEPATEDIPVIFVTSQSEQINEKAGFDVGGVDYITKPITPLILQARVRNHLSLVRSSRLETSYRDAIYMLAEAGHYNDTDTGAHIWRMAAYSRALAEALGWSNDRCEVLELAATMHDTGKLGISDSILKKPGALDEEEFAVMKTHSRIGFGILSRSHAPVFQLAAEIALHHHERWDGSGYPAGLSGEGIPESARIVAIADVFDALSMRRPYKEPWPLNRILTHMRDHAGSHFDPRLLQVFLDIMPTIMSLRDLWKNED